MNFKYLYKIIIFCSLTVFFAQDNFAQSPTVTVSQDSKIPRLLMLKKSLEKANKLSDGYTIQLYYGELEEANSVIRKYRNSYTTWPASIEYETPNYKVWVGNYVTRIDADRALIEIQDQFPSAFILKAERQKNTEKK